MAGTNWHIFTGGTKAKGIDVKENFEWIEGTILPMNAGSKTTSVYDLGSSSFKWNDLHLSGDANIDGNIVISETRYYALAPADFIPESDNIAWSIDRQDLRARTIALALFNAGIHLPHNALITSFKTHWDMGDPTASASAVFYRSDFQGTEVVIGTGTAATTSGYYAVEDTNLTNATVDNSIYNYSIFVSLNPKTSAGTAICRGVTIAYNITKPLP